MLFRFKGLTGLTIEATDGEVGKIKDAFFDDHRWAMRYLVVETGTWLAGREVLISPRAVKKIDWQSNVVQVQMTQQQVEESPLETSPIEPPLRSTQEMRGYRLQTSNDSMVRVEDFLFDTVSWAIRYLVVDTRNGLPGKHVVIPPQWITTVDWNARVVNVGVTRKIVESAPEYRASIDFSTAHETQLYEHYHREGYPQ
jgi:hypothetical protein